MNLLKMTTLLISIFLVFFSALKILSLEVFYIVFFLPFLLFEKRLISPDFRLIIKTTQKKVSKLYAKDPKLKTEYDIDLIELYYNHGKYWKILSITKPENKRMRDIKELNTNKDNGDIGYQSFEHRGLAATKIMEMFPDTKNKYIDLAKEAFKLAESYCPDQTEKDRMRKNINDLNKFK